MYTFLTMPKLFIAMCIIASTTHLMSWVPPSPPPPTAPKTYTEMFDSLFSVISKVEATTGILYERVVPFAKKHLFI